jgi:hypothetical protein
MIKFCFLFLFCFSFSLAQGLKSTEIKSSSIIGSSAINGEALLEINPKRIEKYKVEKDKTDEVIFSVPFAGAQIENKKDKKFLRDKIILSVQLYYSSYKLAKEFSQPVLNKSRFDSLLKVVPSLKRNTYVKWEVFEQTSAKKEEEAKKLFHGFRITYTDAPTEESARDELDYFKRVLSLDSLGSFENIIEEKYKIKAKTFKTGYDPILKSRKEKKIVYDKKGLLNRKEHIEVAAPETTVIKKVIGRKYIPPKGISLDCDFCHRSPLSIPYVRANLDSTVFMALSRIEFDDKNTLVVVDVTGSMAPYSLQVCLWNRLNFKPGKHNHYVLFNDGDAKSTHQKKIGNTGGIYPIVIDSVIDLEKNMIKVMKKGFGGDVPENNLEAIIAGIKKFPKSKEVIMIADNYAPVRDMALLEKIKIPVKVILCGSYNLRYNCDYLNIAKQTKGSLHTMEKDVLNLFDLKEGEIIEINGFNYKLIKGKFQPVF